MISLTPQNEFTFFDSLVKGSAAQAKQTSGNIPVDETSHTSKPTSTNGVKVNSTYP